MSILMDAIKKAEEEGNEAITLEPGPAPRVEPVDEKLAAEKLFAVKSSGGGRYKFWILIVMAVLMLAGGALYYWYPGAPKPAMPEPPPTAVAPPPPLPQPAPEKAPGAAALPKSPEPSSAPQPAEAQPVNTVRINRHPLKEAVNPLSVKGYQAMMARNLEEARKDYAGLLSRDPQNREALLGLAAIALKRGRNALAERYYGRVLEIDPEDPVATANLVNMRNPPDGESRLKSLLRNSPDSGALYFSLGNQYASQSQWLDAQQAYFSAYTKETGNPDYAFNLAVSLDHLNQAALALKYYKLALALSGNGFPGFDPKAAENRIKELEK